jgi:hypothetical protein
MANEPQPIQMSLDPNSYAITNVSMVSDEEMFHFFITSGNQGRQFTATPKHAKRISLLLQQQIEAYEKKFGEIKTQLPTRPQGEDKKEETGLGF